MESLRAYCGNVAAPCYVTDAHGLILFYNEEAVALWGRRPVLGEERWCGSWRIYAHTGEPLPARVLSSGDCDQREQAHR